MRARVHHASILSAVVLALAAPAGGCGGSKAALTCPVGAEGCDCTAGGACDPGLSCRSNLCVSLGSGSAGSGGSLAGGGGAGGSGGTATGGSPAGGAGGRPMPPPPPPSCTNSTGCAAGKVCAIKADGTGTCLDGSGKPCAAGDYCVGGSGLQTLPGNIEGDVCNTVADCKQMIDGHITPVCVAGTGTSGRCAMLCQYADDPAAKKCVTDPQIGIFNQCTRAQVRTLVTLVLEWPCHDQKVTSYRCVANAPPLTSDQEWTLDCMKDRVCGFIGCVTEFGGMTKLSSTAYLDFAATQVNTTLAPLPGGSTGGGRCGADCDCGHCSYCESGTCRYGGEGPYGCYRGCD